MNVLDDKKRKPKIIGFDLDDVILNFNETLHNWHNKVYGTAYLVKEQRSYHLEKMWGTTRDDAVKRVNNFYVSEDHTEVSPVQGAVEGIKKIKETGAKLYIITAKPDTLKEPTLVWLNKHFPNMFEDVYFTNYYVEDVSKKRTKEKICNDLGVEIFIDDSLKNAESISATGIPVLLFDTPWNQAEIKDPITRVHSWEEIVSKLA